MGIGDFFYQTWVVFFFAKHTAGRKAEQRGPGHLLELVIHQDNWPVCKVGFRFNHGKVLMSLCLGF